MAKIEFRNVTKKFGEFSAVKNFNLAVDDKEFVCLVGPSGCGKTTTLRMLAGLEEITEGTIKIGDKIINDIPAKNRDIAMVFQSYALYPHYTIYDNLAFGLRSREHNKGAKVFISSILFMFYLIITGLFFGFSKLIGLILPGNDMLIFAAGVIAGFLMLYMFPESRKDIKDFLLKYLSNWSTSVKKYIDHEEEIRKKIIQTSQLLGIKSQLRKKPKELSGGQRQRVALGRAIIRNPKAFLMDEPLSNLDAKLRVQMRAELERLTKRLKVTSLYVTHDQIEAMTLGNRIVVLDEGIINQVGTPEEVYNKPVNIFVAGFIGSPSMNFIEGKLKFSEGIYKFISESIQYRVPERYIKSIKDFIGKDITMGIRPEHIEFKISKDDSNDLNAIIGVLEPIGSDTFVYLDFSAKKTLIAKVEGISKVRLDEKVSVNFLDDRIHFFDKDSGNRILSEGGMDKTHHEAVLEKLKLSSD